MFSRLVLQLSLHNPLDPGVKSRMKMYLEQRRQALLQLRVYLSNQQVYLLLIKMRLALEVSLYVLFLHDKIMIK